MNISMNEEPTEITVKHEIKEESYCTEYQIPTISALPKDETNKLVIKEEPMDDDELYPFVKVDVNESFPIKTELSNDDPLIKAEPNETLPFIQTETISAGEIVIKEEPTDEKVVYPSNNAVSKINSRTIRAQMLSKNFLVRVIKSYKIQEITLRCQIRNLWREKHRLQNLLRRRNLLGSKGRKPARKLKANYKKYGSPSRKS
ncbi:hypothetical protein QE152_g23759 [Popillia japonica]|uniref:Uncharacterized protein n=1 Tax=Popillia japonica TaxID=7064 RepID=A0AAW1KGU3_POPJA